MRLARRRIQHRRRRFLEHFLMPPLNRTFALAQMNHVAVLVAQHLKFDVPRPLDQLLDVHVGAAEGLLRLGARGLERRESARASSRTMRMPRPPPPSAALIITGKPISVAALARRVFIRHHAVAARNHRQARGRHFLRARGPFRPSGESHPGAAR